MQPTVGPDGKKKEPESNVLLASIENMQYAVTVDVLHTVFSAFGTVQKIAIFEKNGGTQALIQYPDVTTAAVAKEALEGHCIYDGGYCKLHLSYSRHTDLNVKAYSDKSRDYTIQDPSLLATQQIPAVSAASAPWQNPQAAPMYPASEYAATTVPGQVRSWNPSAQVSTPPFVSAAGAFPNQTYPASSVPAYATAPPPAGSSPMSQHSLTMTQPGVQPNMRPGGGVSPPGPPPGHPHYVR